MQRRIERISLIHMGDDHPTRMLFAKIEGELRLTYDYSHVDELLELAVTETMPNRIAGFAALDTSGSGRWRTSFRRSSRRG